MHHYPCIEDDPGVEEWLQPEKWSKERVFHDVEEWVYDDPSKAEQCKEEWEALRRWHTAYATSDSVHIGEPHRIGEKLLYGGAPVLS
eukprot:4651304-Pleurochrysis_carterae.AAC.1